MKKLLTIFALSLIVSACSMPRYKNAQDYREKVKAGTFGMGNFEEIINRPFAQVSNDTHKNIERCFNYRTSAGGKDLQSFRSFFNQESSSRASSAVRNIVYEKNNEGRAYFFLIDYDKLGSSKTKLTYYGVDTIFYRGQIETIKAWANGEKAECPDDEVESMSN